MERHHKEYVLAYCQRHNRNNDGGIIEVLFIHKNRPAWQAGRLNLPGGGIEPGETPEEAAVRELQEEAGLEHKFYPRYCGKMEDRQFTIHIVEVVLENPFAELKARPEETERCEWLAWGDAKEDGRLIPNLQVIVPLCMCGVEGWVIHDEAKSEYPSPHRLSVSVRMN